MMFRESQAIITGFANQYPHQ